VNGITQAGAAHAHTSPQPGEVDMLELLAFAVVAVALATPFVVPLMWGQLEQSSQDTAAVATQDELPIGPVSHTTLTVCGALIATSAFMHAANAQQFRPLPNDAEPLRMVEQCMEMVFGRSSGKEYMHMSQACLDGAGQGAHALGGPASPPPREETQMAGQTYTAPR
jgi:hypothetical protein